MEFFTAGLFADCSKGTRYDDVRGTCNDDVEGTFNDDAKGTRYDDVLGNRHDDYKGTPYDDVKGNRYDDFDLLLIQMCMERTYTASNRGKDAALLWASCVIFSSAVSKYFFRC